jgi:hypothetical protein
VTNTFPLFFSKLNRTSGHVNMPGGRALSAHGAGKLIVKTDGQTKTEKTHMQNCSDRQTDIPGTTPPLKHRLKRKWARPSHHG